MPSTSAEQPARGRAGPGRSRSPSRPGHEAPGDEPAPGIAAPSFVGRQRELATMLAALSTPPALVLVEGEAGIGKTRLVRECLGAPPLRERVVVEAVCPPLPEPFSLGPVVDALHRRWREVGELALSPLAGALRPLFPERGAELPPAPEPAGDQNATRHRLFRALVELVEQLGVQVLVVDDAHWADPATLEFLLILAARGTPDLSLVVSYRPTDVPAGSLLPRLAARAPASMNRATVELEPLNHDETRALVSGMFSTDQVAAEFVAILRERAQGIPLALEESLLLLRDRGDIYPCGGRWTRRAIDQLRVPPTLRDSVLERFARLDRAARRVLRAAAVLAEPADEPALVAVAGLGAVGTRQGLVEALASGLLRQVDPVRFAVRHVLASRAIEEATPVPERRLLHRRAGRLLQRLDNPPAARLSRHFRQAGELAQWRHYAEFAADLAIASGDDRAAVSFLLELLTAAEPPADQLAGLACKLGEVAAGGAAALGEHGEQVIQAIRAVLDRAGRPAGERGQIRLQLGRMLLQMGEFDAGYEQFQQAVPELVDRPALAARATMALAFPRGNDWPASRHLQWLERAVALLPQVRSPADRASLAVDRASALLLLGRQEGWAAADAVGRDAPTLLERRQVARSLMNIGHMAIIWGHYRQARQRLAAAEELMRTTGYERLLNSAQLTLAYLDWHTGAWPGLAERVTEVAEAVDTLPEAHLEARLVRSLLALVQGRSEPGRRELAEVLSEAARRGLLDTQLVPAAALGRRYLADGDPAAAVQITEPGIEIICRKGVWVWAADIAPVHVAALCRTGQRGRATALVARFVDGLAGTDAPAPAAAVQVCQAVLAADAGAPAAAADQFAAAAARWSALPRPYEELLTTEWQGHCLLAAGERSRALQLLGSVQQRLWALGAGWDADRLAQLLRQHGVEVTRTWHGGRRGYGDRLSPREVEVARLVAQGMTNRQVAEALFLSPRTVDRHLSRAMHKLGAASRTGLVLVAAKAGLLQQQRDDHSSG